MERGGNGEGEEGKEEARERGEEKRETRKGKKNGRNEETKKGKGRTHGRVKHRCIVQVCLGFRQALEDR